MSAQASTDRLRVLGWAGSRRSQLVHVTLRSPWWGTLGVGGHRGRMSDTSQGPGWWQASDGKWYPPQPPPPPLPAAGPPPMGADAPQGPGWYQATDGRFYPPQHAVAGVPPVKKPVYKRVWFWLLIVVVVLFAGCGAILAAGTAAIVHAAKKDHTVVYTVTGTGQATDITYATLQQGSGQNGESQVTNVPLPWTKTIIVSGLITAFSLSGTVGTNGGTVTCTISEDGSQLSTNTASGPFASASCSSAGKS